MFLPGDVVKSKKTGSFYTVNKVMGGYWFTHDRSTSPKLMSNFEVVSSKPSWLQPTEWTREYFGVLPCKDGHEHKWVDAGFRFTKMVCYHCDKEQNETRI